MTNPRRVLPAQQPRQMPRVAARLRSSARSSFAVVASVPAPPRPELASLPGAGMGALVPAGPAPAEEFGEAAVERPAAPAPPVPLALLAPERDPPPAAPFVAPGREGEPEPAAPGAVGPLDNPPPPVEVGLVEVVDDRELGFEPAPPAAPTPPVPEPTPPVAAAPAPPVAAPAPAVPAPALPREVPPAPPAELAPPDEPADDPAPPPAEPPEEPPPPPPPPPPPDCAKAGKGAANKAAKAVRINSSRMALSRARQGPTPEADIRSLGTEPSDSEADEDRAAGQRRPEGVHSWRVRDGCHRAGSGRPARLARSADRRAFRLGFDTIGNAYSDSRESSQAMSKKASRPPRKKRANGPAKAQDRAPAPLLAPASQVEPIPLPRTDPVPSLHVDAPPPLRSEPQALESVRTLIRDEIGRQHAIEKSRRPLQMIAEASIRLTEDVLGPGYVIVDEKGTPRTKVEGGGAVPFTIVDLVAELRLEHPNLFQDGSGPGTKLKPPPLQPDPDLVGSTPRPGDQTAPAERTAGLSSEQREPEAGPAPSALMPAQIPLIAPAPTLATRAAPRPAEVTSIRRLPRSPADRTVGPQRRASLLPPAWMPSRTARLRLLYVLAFLGGLAAYGAVRHFA